MHRYRRVSRHTMTNAFRSPVADARLLTPVAPVTSGSARPVPATRTPRRSGRSTAVIRYRVTLHDLAAHLLQVELTIDEPDAEGQQVALAAWIPGSYMIREFARHVVAIEARAAGRRVALTKLDKHTWRAARCKGPLKLTYRVYAWDLSVRAAHVDTTHAFFNGTSVFLRVLGQESCPVSVELAAPADGDAARWRVATTLPRDGARKWGFGGYRAENYDALIDHPVEMGRFTLASFEAAGVPHHVVITGHHDCDTARLCKDLAPVCEAQIRLFEPRSVAAPFTEYLFLTMAVGDGYGGLEHRSSTALIATRDDLPYRGMTGTPEGYRRFLGLCSHEYFHCWHVKRIKPAAFVPYDLDRENYTRLLWIFEGFTSYYDDLMLVRGGAVGVDDYLKALSDTISGVMRGPGRRLQSVAESSFEAWTKYYRQDEQSPNSIVSYYTKGSLVALCLDLTLRAKSGGRRSLDDVMRLMWRRFGRPFDEHPQGLSEQQFPALVAEATGVDLEREIVAWAYRTDELPLADALRPFGIGLSMKAADEAPWLGVRTVQRGTDLACATVYADGPAHRGGLSAGDTLVACDGLRVDERSLKSLLSRRRVGDTVRIHAFRRDELMRFDVRLATAPASDARLAVVNRDTEAARKLRRAWLR